MRAICIIYHNHCLIFVILGWSYLEKEACLGCMHVDLGSVIMMIWVGHCVLFDAGTKRKYRRIGEEKRGLLDRAYF